ncbi:hypothetical protein PENSPDRAFT_658782 [Peniophora sp. CONT]|nr:hypothetical protein PENSPDRAFT_658782 [Peniophora sp. CONT]
MFTPTTLSFRCSAIGVLLITAPFAQAQTQTNGTVLPDGTADSSAIASPSFTPTTVVADAVAVQSTDRQRIIIAVAVTLAAVLLLCIGVVLFLKLVAGRRNRDQSSPPLPTTAMPARVLVGLQFDDRTFYRHIASSKGG